MLISTSVNSWFYLFQIQKKKSINLSFMPMLSLDFHQIMNDLFLYLKNRKIIKQFAGITQFLINSQLLWQLSVYQIELTVEKSDLINQEKSSFHSFTIYVKYVCINNFNDYIALNLKKKAHIQTQRLLFVFRF